MPAFLSRLHHRSILTLLVLIVAGCTGNHLRLPLLVGVDFLFGSIAVFLVVRFFGVGWGTVATIFANLPTILLWHHPYCALISICEAVFVGLLWRSKYQNVILLDVIYWLAIGVPLGWLFYAQLLHIDGTQLWLILLKQPVNGIFNALVASLLITYLPLYNWLGRSRYYNKPSLRQIFLNLLVAFIFFPALVLTFWDNHRAINHIETDIQTELNATATDMTIDLDDWQQQYANALAQLGKLAAAAEMKPVERMLQSMEFTQQVFPDFRRFYVANAIGEVIVSYPTRQETNNTNASLEVIDRSLLQATKAALQPVVSNVHIDSVLGVPVIDLSVPIVADRRFLGYVYGSLNLNHVSKFLRSQSQLGQQLVLVDSNNRIIASSNAEQLPMQVFQRLNSSEIRSGDNRIALWLPLQEQPVSVRWQKSLYIKETKISNNPAWKLVVAIPTTSHISYLQNIYISDLAFMLLTAVLASTGGVVLSQSLTEPLTKLAVATTELPDKLLERDKLNRPHSPVIEIDSLFSNFKLMAIALNEKFREIQTANRTLAQRVQKRTDELLQANRKLASKIVEQQQTEAALRESEEKYRDLFEHANDLIQSIAADGSFLYVNTAWRKTLGYSEAEISNLSVFDTIHPDSLALWRGLFQMGRCCQENNEVQVTFLTKDGKKVLVEGSVSCKYVDGKIVATRGIFRDITERKQAEAEIHYALEKERELIELKSRFITTASHEFRTPLTAILISAKLLEQFGYQATEERRRLYLERIQAATRRMTHLLDDVLLIGKAEAGKLDYNPTGIDVEKFSRELLEDLQHSASNNHTITFASQCQYGIVHLDATLLRYILSNLLSNAIKYSPKGGEITFTLTAIGEEVTFQVQDQGIGIPVADREKLFTSFHRGSNVDNISGTGLGMSIVKRCVDLHGGTIEVKSEIGMGTTFTVALPLKQPVLSATK